MERITVEQAAEQLGLSSFSVRELMRQDQLPIGKVMHGNRRDTFYIWQELIDQYREVRA